MLFCKVGSPRSILFVPVLACFTASAQQQGPEERLLQRDGRALIDEALDLDHRIVRTSLSDMQESDVRKAPGSIMIISARQIKASGARDLLEALQLVPGFTFGRDVDDVVGIGIHGTWAEEGKCLFLLNGLQLNENDFGTYAIGRRIPLDNVERIEVITGPGSVIHGGYAALGVVNIVTRTARHSTGGQATVRVGATREGTTGNEVTVSGNNALGLEQEVSYLATIDRGTRSNRSVTLPDGTPISFKDSTAGQTATFQFGYRWRTMKANVYYMDDNYAVSDGGYSVRMRDVILAVEQRKQITPRTEINWRFGHTDQIPWYYVNTAEQERLGSNTSNLRTRGMGTVNFKATPWLSFRVGFQGFRQVSEFYQRNGVEFRMNNDRRIAMLDAAGFAETELTGKPGKLGLGYRYEYNDLSGRFMAPRASYSKVLGRFHTKLSASRAFKVPTIMNLNYGPEEGDIVAEYATSYEFEIGIRFQRNDQLTVNAYHTSINDPIVYVFDAATLDNYINRNKAGTQGIDVNYRLERDRTALYLSYGCYQALADVDLPETELPNSLGPVFQGLPQQKVSATMAVDVSQTINLHGSLLWQGAKWSYQTVDPESEELDLVRWPSEFLVGAGVGWRSPGSGKWNIDLSAYNLLNVDRHIVSPYNNGTTPLTMNGREASLRITYRFAEQ